MRMKYPPRFVLVAVIVVMSFIPFVQLRCAEGKERRAGNTASVLRVNDGDTITVRINGRSERIRLIGIDAPELGQFPWGVKAKRHLEELLSSSREVFVEFDVDRHDKYGRLLAYVRTGGGRMINEEMLKDGYAVLFTFPPNVRYAKELRVAQKYARERRLGMWANGGLSELPSDYRREHPRQ